MGVSEAVHCPAAVWNLFEYCDSSSAVWDLLSDLYGVYTEDVSGARTAAEGVVWLVWFLKGVDGMIEINNVNKMYRGKIGTIPALNNVSLQIPQGEIIGLFGENGAGKTTLLKCILGYISCAGEILLDGEPITYKNIERISFATCEHSFFPGLTAEEHRQFYREHFKKFREKRFQGLMEFFELPFNRKLKHFSTGQKNQFEVILALSQGADYILMDEPFSGNDVFNREDFYKVLLGILEPEETILLSTHLLEEVEHFIGRAVLIRKGELVADISMMDLEEDGKSLMDFVKEMYHYKADRVMKALSGMTDSE